MLKITSGLSASNLTSTDKSSIIDEVGGNSKIDGAKNETKYSSKKN